ncbi:hypothetical protein [Solimonas sp. SE-A11]|uniref:hypothetical protein n=1 Tax=Solimonas sp. SE-A11 TaxID=3054954 RepID=UPI00259C6B2E|nr:hypothetical protein [Solimonas sp. SE-A11]MDM4769061.1 hypothetical protein [Solimonas sp. SE-A11]
MLPARSDLQPAVEQRIGRNLLRYQLVELRLKALLPFRRVELSYDGIAEIRTRTEKLQVQTLGQLIKAYLDVDDPAMSAERAQRIDEFVVARNWLTHHLLASHGALTSDEDCRACIERLDRDYDAAAVVAGEVLVTTRITIKLFRAFVEAWAKAGADLSEGDQLMRSLEEHLRDEVPIHITVIAPADSVENILALTMRKLHREQKNADGWTHFSSVGRRARQESPDLPKRGLLEIARRIEGFEFAQRPEGIGNAPWMFREAHRCQAP